MVPNELAPDDADLIFRALGDATRRDILARTLSHGHSVSELARRYDMSFAAVQKHVAILERAGLVVKHIHGRERVVSPDLAMIQRTSQLLRACLASVSSPLTESFSNERSHAPEQPRSP